MQSNPHLSKRDIACGSIAPRAIPIDFSPMKVANKLYIRQNISH